MADLKISQLPVFTSAVPATDAFAVVSGGTTKQITTNQILGAGGTATLASATITGAATVGTTLGVTGVSTLASATITGAATVGTTFAVGTVTPDIFARFYTRSIGFDSSGTTALQINGTSYSGVDLGAAGVRTFGITASGTDANISTVTNIPMLFGINNTEAMRLNSTANLVLKGGTANANGVGVTFPATQVASSDANCLDDYEEGTWTIGLEFGGASTGMTKNADTGKYTKIGRQVTVTGYLALTNKGSATGDALITGLPFLINSYGGLSIYLAQITFADFPMGYSNNGTSTIPLKECTNAGVVSSLTNSDFANNSEIIFTMTYTA